MINMKGGTRIRPLQSRSRGHDTPPPTIGTRAVGCKHFYGSLESNFYFLLSSLSRPSLAQFQGNTRLIVSQRQCNPRCHRTNTHNTGAVHSQTCQSSLNASPTPREINRYINVLPSGAGPRWARTPAPTPSPPTRTADAQFSRSRVDLTSPGPAPAFPAPLRCTTTEDTPRGTLSSHKCTW